MSDLTETARLDAITRELEMQAKIDTPVTARDITITSRLERILGALQAGAHPNAYWAQYTNLQDREILAYDAATDTWINKPIGTAAGDIYLQDLKDVNDTISPGVDEFLGWDGSQWDALTIGLANLSDVDDTLTSLDDDMLSYNNATSKWIRQPFAVQFAVDTNFTSGGNILTGTLGSQGIVEHAVIGLDFYVARNGIYNLTAPWDAQNEITATKLLIDSTIDYEIRDNSDALEIVNENVDKSIGVYLNQAIGGVDEYFQFDASGPAFIINPNASAITLSGFGIIKVLGTWGKPGSWSIFDFGPTINNGQSIGFSVYPQYITGASLAVGFSFKPTVGVIAGATMTLTGYNFKPGNPPAGKNKAYTGYLDDTGRLLTTSDTWTHTYIHLGDASTAFTLDAGAVLTETMVDLHGGANALFGAITQTGIKFSGYGTADNGAVVRAVESDGGIFSWKADNAKIVIGLDEDVEMYWDGTDFIIDPTAESAGDVLIPADNAALALGAGAGGDVRIYFDGADLEIDLAAVGNNNMHIGDGGTTDYIEIDDTGDVLYKGGAGIAYGEISVVGNAAETAIGGAGTAVQVTIFDTDGPSNNSTPDHTNDHITVTEAGHYFIAVSATVNSVLGIASRFEMTVQKNNGDAAIGALHCDRNLGGGGTESGVISMSGIVDLATSDTIEVWLENETNTQNYVVENITLTLMQVGGT